MLLGILILLAAGGGLYAAAHGIFGVLAQADVAKLKTNLLAELVKIEAAGKADEVAIVAKVKSILAKL